MLTKAHFVILHDLLMIPLAWLGAFWLRANLGPIPSESWQLALQLLPTIMLTQASVYGYFKLQRGMWNFASIADLERVVKTVLIGTIASVLVCFFTQQWIGLSRAIFPTYALLLSGGLGGSRFLLRWWRERRGPTISTERVLIIGAGKAAEVYVRDWLHSRASTKMPIGLLDDNYQKWGQEIHGVAVLGAIEALPRFARENDITEIVIAIPSANAQQMRRIVALCEATKLPFRTLPSLLDLANGHVNVTTTRAVNLQDLLGREPIALDHQTIRNTIAGRTILVSGGGGSIGSELCRQVALFQPQKMIIVDNCEYNLYRIERELLDAFPSTRLQLSLASITDELAMRQLFSQQQPDVVFHAAAYKHVPLLETQLAVAVQNNIFGSKILAEVAQHFAVKKFVLVSTDKAVNPSNIMGLSKRVAEIICQHYARVSTTQFITVRFGNVLGSAGSVIPLFHEQIAAGGPVTVTHPEMERYFMTIPEATQLILQASSMGRGGDIFVLDMGEPIKIRFLAEQLIYLSGKVPYQDIDIVYSGVRPGEKIFEELLHEQESLASTSHQKLLTAKSRPVSAEILQTVLFECAQALQQQALDQVLLTLQKLVPEYQAQQPLAETSCHG